MACTFVEYVDVEPADIEYADCGRDFQSNRPADKRPSCLPAIRHSWSQRPVKRGWFGLFDRVHDIAKADGLGDGPERRVLSR